MAISRFPIEATIYALIASVYLMALLRFNPRLFLQDYPPDIQERVPPETETEARQSRVLGLPFVLLLLL